jgi:hypothetical protein
MGGIMSAEQSKVGIGGPTSGEAGSTLTHETMAETGGSGGSALTQPRKEESTEPSSGASQSGQTSVDAKEAEGAGTAATAIGRGAQDTRSQQAGINPTGLGTPETGGNQSEDDLAPPRQP